MAVLEKMSNCNMENSQSERPSVKAICATNVDPWSHEIREELCVGEAYTPDYLEIGRSYSCLYLKEYPGKRYNSVMFSYLKDDGHIIDFAGDLIHPVMKRYRDYLYNELILTNIWTVYIQFDESPINTVHEKCKYRIFRYESFDLVNKREGSQDEK